MSFKRLYIRFQTARSLPAPYAYFYTLAAQPVGSQALQVDFSIAYPDRDDIDDDELQAEGYTRNDDFSWSGQLPKAWLETMTSVADKTQLEPVPEESLGEDDDFWEITIETEKGPKKQGRPTNASRNGRINGGIDDWQYLVQELIQAAHESMGRERPFELTYLNLDSPRNEQELYLTASFAERRLKILCIRSQRESVQTLPWAILQTIMRNVYEHDFNPDEAQFKRPNRNGHWLNLGTDEWYDIHDLRALVDVLDNLCRTAA